MATASIREKSARQADINLAPLSFNFTILNFIGKQRAPVSIIKIRKELQTDYIAKTMGYLDKSTGSISGSLNRLFAAEYINRETDGIHKYTITEGGKKELQKAKQILTNAKEHILNENIPAHAT